VGLRVKLKSVNVSEVLEVDITSFASKSSYCSKGAPQKGKSELCPDVCYDRCIRLPQRFSAIFSASLVFIFTFKADTGFQKMSENLFFCQHHKKGLKHVNL